MEAMDDDSVERLFAASEAQYGDLVDQCTQELLTSGCTSIRLPSMTLDAEIARSRWSFRKFLLTHGTVADGRTFASRTPLHRSQALHNQRAIRIRLLVDLTQSLEH